MKRPRHPTAFTYVTWLALMVGVSGCTDKDATTMWWKGNLHTHSLWSDGDDFPEVVSAWYKDAGYHFLAISDHNTLQEGERWISVSDLPGGEALVEQYREVMGADWVQTDEGPTGARVLLKPLAEYRQRLEEPNSFLLIQSEEISDSFEGKPIHLNATNVAEFIEPQGGTSVVDVMQRNVDAVLAQRGATGQPMFPHINHPNFGWAITPDEIARVEGERFFEVYNGHHLVHTYGDSLRSGTERIWDIVLTKRLLAGRPVMYGIAVDDAHDYQDSGADKANPGRAWIMVWARTLETDLIIDGLEAGRFYSTTGVTLDEFNITETEYAFEIEPEEGVSYRTLFVGTMRTDAVNQGMDASPLLYGDGIGRILAEVEGLNPSYSFMGNEMYVRAKVISSKQMDNAAAEGEFEVAWTQPVIPVGSD